MSSWHEESDQRQYNQDWDSWRVRALARNSKTKVEILGAAAWMECVAHDGRLQGNRTRRAPFEPMRFCRTKWKPHRKRTLSAGSMPQQAGEGAPCNDERKLGQRAAKATDHACRNGTENPRTTLPINSGGNHWVRHSPLAAGGLLLRSAERLRHAAHWASWADMIKMLYKRVPDVATRFTLLWRPARLHRAFSHTCIASLGSVGFPVPSWEELLDESDEPQVEEEVDPTQPRRGWQRKATMVVDASFRQHTILPALEDAQQPPTGRPCRRPGEEKKGRTRS